MTTIAYRNGVMAADSRAYSGGSSPIGSKVKIRRLPDSTLVGVSSTIIGAGDAVMDWFAAGQSPGTKLPEDYLMLAVDKTGKAFISDSKTGFVSGPLTDEYFAIGTGNQYAIGAMRAGVDVVQAVRIACQFDVWSAEPVYMISHTSDLARIK